MDPYMNPIKKIRKMSVPPQEPEGSDIGVEQTSQVENSISGDRAAYEMDLPPWARIAVPSARAPDVRADLSVLVGKTGLGMLDQKPSTTIVPTIFPGLNRALHVAGIPASCMAVLHGPSKGGKTALLLGLIRSFQLGGHMSAYIDAEFSLEKLFSSQLGVDNSQLIYRTPESFEETTGIVEDLIVNFRKGREAKKIDPNRCLIIGVDSINKLVPKDELEKLRVTGKQFPIRALLTTIWFDRLTPVVGNLPVLFAAIAHEKVKMDAGMFGKKYRVKGGETLIYDSTVAFRVTMTKVLKSTRGGVQVPIGQVHQVKVEKSKVGISHEVFNFVMSNGKGTSPIGFDHVREVMEEIKLRGGDQPLSVVKAGPSWKSEMFPGGIIKGDMATAEWFYSNPAALDQIIMELNVTSTDAVVNVDLGEDGDDIGDQGND